MNTEEWHGEERRKFLRLKVELLVRYKILCTPERQYDAETKDIGGGGVCLVTREQLGPGTVVAMEIKFPKSVKPLMAGGRVVWSRESALGPSPAGHARFDNGVEFMQISDMDRQRIVEHVKSEQEQKKEKGQDWKIGIVRDLGK